MTFLPYLLGGLAGLLAGWLVNVIALRFPNAERPLIGAFHCTASGERLSVLDCLPLLGYLLQRGRCRHCGKPLPWSWPAVEIAMALSFAFAWTYYQGQPLYIYIVNLFYIFLLTTIGLIDWRHRLIFPIMTWTGFLISVIVGIFGVPPLGPDQLPDKHFYLPDGVGSVLLGAAVGGGLFYLIYLIAYGIYKRRALGFGDVLLAILIGGITGWPRVVSALFLGAVLGGMVAIAYFFFGGKRWRDFIPYGTTLCLGIVLILIWGTSVWTWGPFGLLTWALQVLFSLIASWLFNAPFKVP